MLNALGVQATWVRTEPKVRDIRYRTVGLEFGKESIVAICDLPNAIENS